MIYDNLIVLPVWAENKIIMSGKLLSSVLRLVKCDNYQYNNLKKTQKTPNERQYPITTYIF